MRIGEDAATKVYCLQIIIYAHDGTAVGGVALPLPLLQEMGRKRRKKELSDVLTKHVFCPSKASSAAMSTIAAAFQANVTSTSTATFIPSRTAG